MSSFEIIQPELGEISKWKHLSDQELCLYVMNMIDSSGLCGDWQHNIPESNSTSYLYGEHWSRQHHSASYLHDSHWNNRIHHEVENYYAKKKSLMESERPKPESRFLMSLVLSVVFSILALILLMTLNTQGGGGGRSGDSGGQGSSSSGSDHQRNPHQNSNLPDPQQNSNSKKPSN